MIGWLLFFAADASTAIAPVTPPSLEQTDSSPTAGVGTITVTVKTPVLEETGIVEVTEQGAEQVLMWEGPDRALRAGTVAVYFSPVTEEDREAWRAKVWTHSKGDREARISAPGTVTMRCVFDVRRWWGTRKVELSFPVQLGGIGFAAARQGEYRCEAAQGLPPGTSLFD